MRILITGAAGRIGSRLVPRLLERGDALRVLVRNEEQAEYFRGHKAEAAIGDLLKAETLAQAVTGVEAVVHLAAFFRGASPAEAQATNFDGTLALAHAARSSNVSRLIYISTNLVYGPGRGRPAREQDIPQPAPGRAYPAGKLAAEQALGRLYQDSKTELTILRLAFVYGEGDPHLKEALDLTRGWPGAKRLHAIHHADVAQGILLSLDSAQAGGRIYNVADDVPISVAEIRQLNGSAEAQETADGPLEDPWEGIVDTTRIKTELGFQPIYPSVRAAQTAKVL